MQKGRRWLRFLAGNAECTDVQFRKAMQKANTGHQRVSSSLINRHFWEDIEPRDELQDLVRSAWRIVTQGRIPWREDEHGYEAVMAALAEAPALSLEMYTGTYLVLRKLYNGAVGVDGVELVAGRPSGTLAATWWIKELRDGRAEWVRHAGRVTSKAGHLCVEVAPDERSDHAKHVQARFNRPDDDNPWCMTGIAVGNHSLDTAAISKWMMMIRLPDGASGWRDRAVKLQEWIGQNGSAGFLFEQIHAPRAEVERVPQAWIAIAEGKEPTIPAVLQRETRQPQRRTRAARGGATAA